MNYFSRTQYTKLGQYNVTNAILDVDALFQLWAKNMIVHMDRVDMRTTDDRGRIRPHGTLLRIETKGQPYPPRYRLERITG